MLESLPPLSDEYLIAPVDLDNSEHRKDLAAIERECPMGNDLINFYLGHFIDRMENPEIRRAMSQRCQLFFVRETKANDAAAVMGAAMLSSRKMVHTDQNFNFGTMIWGRSRPKHRRKGLLQHLSKRCEAWLLERHCDLSFVVALQGNIASRTLFTKKCGFHFQYETEVICFSTKPKFCLVKPEVEYASQPVVRLEGVEAKKFMLERCRDYALFSGISLKTFTIMKCQNFFVAFDLSSAYNLAYVSRGDDSFVAKQIAMATRNEDDFLAKYPDLRIPVHQIWIPNFDLIDPKQDTSISSIVSVFLELSRSLQAESIDVFGLFKNPVFSGRKSPLELVERVLNKCDHYPQDKDIGAWLAFKGLTAKGDQAITEMKQSENVFIDKEVL